MSSEVLRVSKVHLDAFEHSLHRSLRSLRLPRSGQESKNCQADFW